MGKHSKSRFEVGTAQVDRLLGGLGPLAAEIVIVFAVVGLSVPAAADLGGQAKESKDDTVVVQVDPAR